MYSLGHLCLELDAFDYMIEMRAGCEGRTVCIRSDGSDMLGVTPLPAESVKGPKYMRDISYMTCVICLTSCDD